MALLGQAVVPVFPVHGHRPDGIETGLTEKREEIVAEAVGHDYSWFEVELRAGALQPPAIVDVMRRSKEVLVEAADAFV
jgi:hypothetical protein